MLLGEIVNNHTEGISQKFLMISSYFRINEEDENEQEQSIRYLFINTTLEVKGFFVEAKKTTKEVK